MATIAPSLFERLDARIEDFDRRGAIDLDVDAAPHGKTLRGGVLQFGTILGDYAEYRDATVTASRDGRLLLTPADGRPVRVLRGEVLFVPSR